MLDVSERADVVLTRLDGLPGVSKNLREDELSLSIVRRHAEGRFQMRFRRRDIRLGIVEQARELGLPQDAWLAIFCA